MARTVINPQTFIGSYPTLPISAGGADITFTANSDPTDRYAVLVNSKTLVLVYNSDVSSHTITIGSAPDSLNRLGDIAAYAVAAGKISVFGPFQTAGWANSGNLNIDVSDAHLLIAIITLP